MLKNLSPVYAVRSDTSWIDQTEDFSYLSDYPTLFDIREEADHALRRAQRIYYDIANQLRVVQIELREMEV